MPMLNMSTLQNENIEKISVNCLIVSDFVFNILSGCFDPFCVYNVYIVELRYLEHSYFEYNGYVEVICKSNHLFFKYLFSISQILRYLKVFKQAHLVRDNEVTLYLLLLIYAEYILKVQLSYILYLLTNQGPSIILNDGVLYNY